MKLYKYSTYCIFFLIIEVIQVNANVIETTEVSQNDLKNIKRFLISLNSTNVGEEIKNEKILNKYVIFKNKIYLGSVRTGDEKQHIFLFLDKPTKNNRYAFIWADSAGSSMPIDSSNEIIRYVDNDGVNDYMSSYNDLLIIINPKSNWLRDIVGDDQRLKEYLLSLSNTGVGSLIDGVEMSFGAKLLKGKIYLGQVKTFDAKHNIFILEDYNNGYCNYEKHLIAVAWISNGGSPIPIPKYPKGFDCSAEAAYTIEDVYLSSLIKDDSGVVIVTYPDSEWIESLGNCDMLGKQ